jgi:hypothetical protein
VWKRYGARRSQRLYKTNWTKPTRSLLSSYIREKVFILAQRGVTESLTTTGSKRTGRGDLIEAKCYYEFDSTATAHGAGGCGLSADVGRSLLSLSMYRQIGLYIPAASLIQQAFEDTLLSALTPITETTDSRNNSRAGTATTTLIQQSFTHHQRNNSHCRHRATASQPAPASGSGQQRCIITSACISRPVP